MAEEKKAAKAAILDELESIIGLLDEEPLAEESTPPSPQENAVRVSADKIRTDNIVATGESDPGCKEADPSEDEPGIASGSLAPLPGQQSLFCEADTSNARPNTNRDINTGQDTNTQQATRTKTDKTENNETSSEENPFLPQHIRDRLQGNKPHLGMQDFVPNKKNMKPLRSAQTQAIVNELVADYLPKLEAELRQRLENLLQDEDPGQDSPN